MPRKKLSSARSQTRYPEGLNSSLKSYFFKGVALSGANSDKTAVADIEYFIKKNKIFLHGLKSKIKAEEGSSSDESLIKLLNNYLPKTKYISVNSSLSLPKCVKCRLQCPGIKACKVPEIVWQKKSYKEILKSKRKKKFITPYTRRCAEIYVSYFLEEKFDVSDAMGANHAPLMARMLYIQKHVKSQFIETFPKLSLWRIGRSLGIQKSYLRFHKHAVSGSEVREAIISQLIDSDVCFIYEEDRRTLIEDNQSFDAFICALTGVLKYKKMVEPKPKNYPPKAAWIEIPQQKLKFK